MGDVWDILVSGPGPGAYQMAFDEAMMDDVLASGRPLLRLYRFVPRALSLGRGQGMGEAYLPGVREIGADLVRRPSGGRAVLHDDEVTYAVAAPSHLFAPGVEASYGQIAGALIRAGLNLGREVSISDPGTSGGELAANCFIHPSVHEIALGGRKVIGSAQVRHRGVLLQHGAIPIRLHPRDWAACFAPPDDRDRWADTMAERAAGLFDEGGAPAWDVVAGAVADGFQEHFGITWHPLDEGRRRRLDATARREGVRFDLADRLAEGGKVVTPWKS